MAPRCTSYDAIVIGAGIQGSFAAYHLAQRRRDTLLLEQFFLPHSRGSSHGQSRITRSAYPEQHYARMMPHSFHLWQQLEDEAGIPLYRRTGLVVLGPPGDPKLEGCRHSMGPDAVLDALTLAQRFPGLRPRPGEVALWDSSGGVLLANRALQAVQDAFRRRGGTVRDGEKVLRIDPGAVITVTTTAGLYRAPRLIIAAGAWTNAVVAPLGLRLPLQVRAGGHRWRPSASMSAARSPPASCGGGTAMSLPFAPTECCLQVCYHHGSPTDPEERDRTPPGSPRPHVTLLSTFISSYLPGLEPQPAVLESCLYTVRPILHPGPAPQVQQYHHRGHGFKLAPVVGQLLCELSLGEEPSHCMAPFTISRFPGVLRAAL
uniref:Pipecolic acid and sarcosine oxidase n=1 Tax=Phasianus colchicus TaxID=9054 RepID=A0A669PIG7_PHACC